METYLYEMTLFDLKLRYYEMLNFNCRFLHNVVGNLRQRKFYAILYRNYIILNEPGILY